MYRINKLSNDITRLEERQFKDLGFKEREHLQEWIAKNPDVLGCICIRYIQPKLIKSIG